jgi:hypothetical protein
MKQTITTLLVTFFVTSIFGQQFISGDYDTGLKLSYDSTNKKVTGYFEDYTGLGEQNSNPRFSCIFYIEGTVTGNKIDIKSYYPSDKGNDLIQGAIEILTDKKVKIKLLKEHGGCWNVQHFADEQVTFTLEKKQTWMQIRYVSVAKAYFYSGNSENQRLKSYLINGNFICIDKIEGQWAYCTYFGLKTTKGWLMLSDLNKL